jgi:hypothetical protein
MAALIDALTTPPRRRLRTVLSVLALLGTAWLGASLGAWAAAEPTARACTHPSLASGP